MSILALRRTPPRRSLPGIVKVRGRRAGPLSLGVGRRGSEALLRIHNIA